MGKRKNFGVRVGTILTRSWKGGLQNEDRKDRSDINDRLEEGGRDICIKSLILIQ